VPTPTPMDLDAVPTPTPVVIASTKKCNFAACTKRLLLSDLACRCGHRFCSTHRYSNEHMCAFDYRKMGAASLSTSLVKCVASSLKDVV